ncbi:MAG: hypothetical protein ABI947_01580 [Chloroflexota bacterium]
MDWLEEFWNDLLSEEPLRVIAVWSTLDAEEKLTIYEHLTHMATEAGWADVQRIAAQAAIHAIDSEAH